MLLLYLFSSHQLTPVVQGSVVKSQSGCQPLSQVVLTVQLHIVRIHVGLLSQASGRQEPGLVLRGHSSFQAHEVGHFLDTLPCVQLSAQLVVHIAQVGPGIEVTGVFFANASENPTCTERVGLKKKKKVPKGQLFHDGSIFSFPQKIIHTI